MPFQSEKQKKWMWANKPEMAREWTQEYGSKVKAKTGTMAKDKNWIQKATKNMRKDKPCTGDKFGGPTCPKGTRRYNLAKTFRKMNKAGGGPVKAVLGLYAMSKMSDKKKDKVKSHFKKRASLSPVASQFFNKGGPIKAKDSKFINKPSKWDKSLKNIRKTYTLANELKVEDKLTAADLENARKIIKSGRMPPHHSRNTGGPIKAKHGDFVQEPVPHADITKYIDRTTWKADDRGKSNRTRQGTMTIKKKGAGPKGGAGRAGRVGKGLGKKPKIIIIDTDSNLKILGDQAKGGQGFTPGWKPQLSVKTAKKGSLLTTGLKGYDVKKVSSKTHQKFMKLFKHREVGGWKEATGYKKHLKALKKMQKTPLSGTSTTLPPKTARLLSQLKFAYKDRNKSKFVKRKMTLSAMGKASPATMKAASTVMGSPAKATALGVGKTLLKRTGIGKAVLAGTAVAGAYEAGKRKIFDRKNLEKGLLDWTGKNKKKVQKKSTGGEIIIGRGVDLDLL